MTKNNCEELNQMIKKLQGQLIQKDKEIALNKQIIAQKEQIIADNKQIINQQIKKDKIFTKSICIEPSIYKDYDDKQNGMEEEEELDNKAYEKEYQAFLKSINLGCTSPVSKLNICKRSNAFSTVVPGLKPYFERSVFLSIELKSRY